MRAVKLLLALVALRGMHACDFCSGFHLFYWRESFVDGVNQSWTKLNFNSGTGLEMSFDILLILDQRLFYLTI